MWLKTIDIGCLLVLELESEIRVSAGPCSLSDGSGVRVCGGPSLPLPASSGYPQPLASHQSDGRLLAMCLHIISSLCMSVCVQTPPFYKDTIRFGLGATLVTSLSLGYLCKDPICKLSPQSEIPGLRIPTYLSEGHTSAHVRRERLFLCICATPCLRLSRGLWCDLLPPGC